MPAEQSPPKLTIGKNAGRNADKSLPVSLRQVPGDAAGFVHVRLGELWSSPAMADFRQLLSKVSPEAWAVFEKKFAPAPSSIDTFTIVFLGPDSFGQWSSGDPDAVTPLFVVSTSKPYDRAQFGKALGTAQEA